MGHLDPKQPPVRRKPYAAILNQDFIYKARWPWIQDEFGWYVFVHWKAELILAEELYELIKTDFFKEQTSHIYSKVILPLKALLEGEFFNEYIKKGKIIILVSTEF